MTAFERINICGATDHASATSPDANTDALLVAEAGCSSGEIVKTAMAAGLTVPMGARPSVGAGAWLQGGIGHLARLHGLTRDAVIGAIVVSVSSGRVFCVGYVPVQHIPNGAMRPECESDLLWALKGAGSNFGIVISVTFKCYTAPTYSIRSLVTSLSDEAKLQLRLRDFAEVIATHGDRNSSADAFLYLRRGPAASRCRHVYMFHDYKHDSGICSLG